MTAPTISTESDTLRLARALADPEILGHPVTDVEVIETHISVVLLTGAFAYKLRKPVLLPFLDFRTLASRLEDCKVELALNRRWAPDLYLRVVDIHGTPDRPDLHGTGPVLDHAVQMRQFPGEARLDRVIADHGLDDALIENLAQSVAGMHLAAPAATVDSGWGRPDLIEEQVQGNLDALAAAPLAARERDCLERLSAFSRDQQARVAARLRQRLEGGMVRECHGDLHLANLVLLDGQVLPFDGVEFREDFRWVDIISDLAFLLMDLHRIDRSREAWLLLDAWLAQTADHAGLAVLRHYLVYRALVRAKVEAIRYQQLAPDQTPEHYQPVADYLALAERLSEPSPASGLVITHGVSGTGKSVLARQLLPGLGAVMLRSDVERKRLFPQAEGRYTAASTQALYRHLLQRAQEALSADYPVILDATFLDAHRRREARRLAGRCGVPFRILSLDAPRDLLESRIRARLHAGTDASEADLGVLEHQLRTADPLDADEREVSVVVDSSAAVEPAALADALGLWTTSRPNA